MSNHESGPDRLEQTDNHGRSRAENARRDAVLAADDLVLARLHAHKLAAQERAESPQGTRIERARQAIGRAWTERGDRKLTRQARRAGMLDDPIYAAAIEGFNSEAETEAKELISTSQEDEAIARAHAILDQPGKDDNVDTEIDEAREAVQNAPDSVPSSLEVKMEESRHLDGPDDESSLSEAANWSAEDPASEIPQAQEIDSIGEPTKLKQTLWRAWGRLRRR